MNVTGARAGGFNLYACAPWYCERHFYVLFYIFATFALLAVAPSVGRRAWLYRLALPTLLDGRRTADWRAFDNLGGREHYRWLSRGTFSVFLLRHGGGCDAFSLPTTNFLQRPPTAGRFRHACANHWFTYSVSRALLAYLHPEKELLAFCIFWQHTISGGRFVAPLGDIRLDGSLRVGRKNRISPASRVCSVLCARLVFVPLLQHSVPCLNLHSAALPLAIFLCGLGGRTGCGAQ